MYTWRVLLEPLPFINHLAHWSILDTTAGTWECTHMLVCVHCAHTFTPLHSHMCKQMNTCICTHMHLYGTFTTHSHTCTPTSFMHTNTLARVGTMAHRQSSAHNTQHTHVRIFMDALTCMNTYSLHILWHACTHAILRIHYTHTHAITHKHLQICTFYTYACICTCTGPHM